MWSNKLGAIAIAASFTGCVSASPPAPVKTTGSLKFDPGSQLIGQPGSTDQISVVASAGQSVQLSIFPYSDTGVIATKPVFEHAVTASAQGAHGRATFAVANLGTGFYQVRATTSGSTQPAITSFVILPKISAMASNLGVNTHFAQGKGELPRSLDLIKEAGFGWIRDELPWGGLEKKAGDFSFNPRLDQYINQAVALDISPLIVLDYANLGVYPNPDPKTSQRGLITDTQRQAFARYATVVASRYKGKVKTWEVWNEPKPDAFGTKDWSGYSQLLKTVYPALKRVDPGNTVIACGGGGAGGGPGGDCINGVLQSGGAGSLDAYSIHPYMAPYDPDLGYPAHNSPTFKSVNVGTVSAFTQRFGRAHAKTDGTPLPVWVTEIGWFSSPLVNDKGGEMTQAAYVSRTVLEATRYKAVKGLFWYDFQDDGSNPSSKEHNFGLIRQDFSPKPAYLAAAVVNSELGGATFQRALVDTDSAKVLEFSRNGKMFWVGWSISSGPAAPNVQLPTGQFVETDWQGKQRTISRTNGDAPWPLTAQPRFLERASG